MDMDCRKKFDEFYKGILTMKSEQFPPPPTLGKLELNLPPELECFEMYFEVSFKCDSLSLLLLSPLFHTHIYLNIGTRTSL